MMAAAGRHPGQRHTPAARPRTAALQLVALALVLAAIDAHAAMVVGDYSTYDRARQIAAVLAGDRSITVTVSPDADTIARTPVGDANATLSVTVRGTTRAARAKAAALAELLSYVQPSLDPAAPEAPTVPVHVAVRIVSAPAAPSSRVAGAVGGGAAERAAAVVALLNDALAGNTFFGGAYVQPQPSGPPPGAAVPRPPGAYAFWAAAAVAPPCPGAQLASDVAPFEGELPPCVQLVSAAAGAGLGLPQLFGVTSLHGRAPGASTTRLRVALAAGRRMLRDARA